MFSLSTPSTSSSLLCARYTLFTPTQPYFMQNSSKWPRERKKAKGLCAGNHRCVSALLFFSFSPFPPHFPFSLRQPGSREQIHCDDDTTMTTTRAKRSSTTTMAWRERQSCNGTSPLFPSHRFIVNSYRRRGHTPLRNDVAQTPRDDEDTTT